MRGDWQVRQEYTFVPSIEDGTMFVFKIDSNYLHAQAHTERSFGIAEPGHRMASRVSMDVTLLPRITWKA